MTARALILLVLPLLTLSACFDGDNDEVSYPSCDQTSIDAPWDEESPLGFSPAAVAETLEGTHPVLMANAMADENVELAEGTVTLALDGTATFVDQEVAPVEGDGAQPAIAIVCDDYVGLPGSVDVFSEDAGVDVAVDVEVQTYDGESGSFYAELSAADVAPLFEDIDESQYDDTHISMSGTFSASGATGSIDYIGEGSDEDTAWSMVVASVTWEAVDGG